MSNKLPKATCTTKHQYISLCFLLQFGNYASDLGGVLGLWFGLSLFALLEYVEFFSDLFVYAYRRCCSNKDQRAGSSDTQPGSHGREQVRPCQLLRYTQNMTLDESFRSDDVNGHGGDLDTRTQAQLNAMLTEIESLRGAVNSRGRSKNGKAGKQDTKQAYPPPYQQFSSRYTGVSRRLTPPPAYQTPPGHSYRPAL